MGTFGERLRDAMMMAGAPVERLAAACDASPLTVAGWLKMREAYLSGKHLALAGLALGVSIRWLALGIGDPSPIGLEEARKARSMM